MSKLAQTLTIPLSLKNRDVMETTKYMKYIMRLLMLGQAALIPLDASVLAVV